MENDELIKQVIEVGQEFLYEYFFNNFDYVICSEDFKDLDEMADRFRKYIENNLILS